MTLRVLQPPGWARPSGYSNGIAAEAGTLVFIGGQIGWDGEGRFHSSDFTAQARQALANIVAILAEAGGKPEHIVRMVWYVTDKREYLSASAAIGAVYREVMGRHYPAMTAIEVAALIEDAAKVEIEATAVIPARPSATPRES
jgi:enamine deaminase RidA (YjgF/YER057c/UK114 family)